MTKAQCLKKAKSERKKSSIMAMVENELRPQHEIFADVFLEWVEKIDNSYAAANGLPMDELQLTIAYTFYTKGLAAGTVVYEDEHIYNLNARKQ